MTIRLLPIYLLTIFLLFSCGGTKSTSSSLEKEKGKEELSEADRVKFENHLFEAFNARSLNNSTEARAAFNKCLSIDPNNSTVHYELARLDAADGDIPSAKSHLDNAIEQDPENYWMRLFRADLNMETGSFKSAIDEYEYLIESYPDREDVYLDLAAAYLYSEDIKGAIETYDKLETQIGVTEEISIQKHQLYVELEDAQNAEYELIKLSESAPGETAFLAYLFQFYEKNGYQDKARKTLDQMIRIDPEDGNVQLYIAEYYASQGKEAESYEALKKAFADPQVNVREKINLVLSYLTMGNPNSKVIEQSLELLEIMKLAHPQEATVYGLLGDIFRQNGEASKALEMYLNSKELDPSEINLWRQISGIYLEQNSMNELKSTTKQAIELFPTQPEFYLYRGIALTRTGNHEEAIEVLSVGKELVFDNPSMSSDFYSTLGDTYHKVENHEKSDESYDLSLQYNPDNVYVLNNYAYYLSIRKTQLDKAEEMARKANNLQPNQPSFLDTLAWILFCKGEYEEAEQLQLKAINLSKDNGVLLEHYGDIIYHLDRKDEAIKYWERALDSGSASDLVEKKISEGKFIDE